MVDKLPPTKYALLNAVIENATGIPVDGIAQVNIDFFQGYSEDQVKSIFSYVFSEKYPLEVVVPYNYVDEEYPLGVGVTTVEFVKGQILTAPEDIVRYARSRKGFYQNDNGDWVQASDLERQRKQQQIMQQVIMQLMRMTFDDLSSGNTDTLKRVIFGLEQQREQHNFFHDEFDFVEVLKTIDRALTELSPQAKLALVSNSGSLLSTMVEDRNSVINSFSLIVSQYPTIPVGDGKYSAYRLSNDFKKNEFGDYVPYYGPIREVIMERFQLK